MTTALAFAGDLCLDVNVIGDDARHEAGGGVLHGAVTAARLGVPVRAWAKTAPADQPRFGALDAAGVEVHWVESPASTSIRNEYPPGRPDQRTSRILGRAAPFTAYEVAALSADILHLNPLWAGLFPAEHLPLARTRARVLSADAQGFLRHAAEDGTLEQRPWPEAARYLPLLDVLKVDAGEARTLTGLDDRVAAARALRDLGARTVLLTFEDGVLAFDGEDLHEARWSGWTLEGRTGRGDTCTAAFLVGLAQGLPLPAAVALAARITSAKMQYRGPYRG